MSKSKLWRQHTLRSVPRLALIQNESGTQSQGKATVRLTNRLTLQVRSGEQSCKWAASPSHRIYSPFYNMTPEISIFQVIDYFTSTDLISSQTISEALHSEFILEVGQHHLGLWQSTSTILLNIYSVNANGYIQKVVSFSYLNMKIQISSFGLNIYMKIPILRKGQCQARKNRSTCPRISLQWTTQGRIYKHCE